jgi:hypothetical protein
MKEATAKSKKAVIKKKSASKKVKTKKTLGKIDFDKIQSNLDKEQEKNKILKPISGIKKPPLRRVKLYDNGVEMYLSDNRKVAIALESDGSFVIETKKALKTEEPFSGFSPAKIKYMKKWGIKVASCQLNISKEALIAIGMIISKMQQSGVLKDEK